MGIWARIGKILGVVEEIAPLLPIPDKGKRIIQKAGVAEHAIADVVREAKPVRTVGKSDSTKLK